jgi:hypothetical protein
MLICFIQDQGRNMYEANSGQHINLPISTSLY